MTKVNDITLDVAEPLLSCENEVLLFFFLDTDTSKKNYA